MSIFDFLKKHNRKTDQEKPDGTIQYHDEHGNLQEKWMPPEQLKDLLKKGGAKRVYKVLIKGPWDGIKEDYWKLSGDTVKKFADENNIVYVVCVYEKGEPKYNFVAKRMWEKFDEIGQIVSNQNLSAEQQAEEVKKLLGD